MAMVTRATNLVHKSSGWTVYSGPQDIYSDKEGRQVLLVRSAGAAVVRRKQDGVTAEVLVIQRSNQPYLELPKGHLEHGETPVIAARREILEETGLNIPFVVTNTLLSEHSYPVSRVDPVTQQNTVPSRYSKNCRNRYCTDWDGIVIKHVQYFYAEVSSSPRLAEKDQTSPSSSNQSMSTETRGHFAAFQSGARASPSSDTSSCLPEASVTVLALEVENGIADDIILGCQTTSHYDHGNTKVCRTKSMSDVEVSESKELIERWKSSMDEFDDVDCEQETTARIWLSEDKLDDACIKAEPTRQAIQNAFEMFRRTGGLNCRS